MASLGLHLQRLMLARLGSRNNQGKILSPFGVMSSEFPIQPLGRFNGASQPVKRPKEFACFSYDDNHEFLLGDSSLRYYYTPALGVDLSNGYDTFIKYNDSKPEHLASLLKTIKSYEEETGQKIDAQIVTWRGMMTKIMGSPFDDRDGFEMNATLYQDCIFIEENHEYKTAMRQQQIAQSRRSPIPLEVMQFWGYKFETLATLPAPWGDTPRDYIENRPHEIVNNNAQYCSVVRTGIGQTVICVGGEVDAVWDSKPTKQGAPTRWVELKTSAEIRNERDSNNFHRKMMRFWIQSFLLGVPKIIVGFRSDRGMLTSIEEFETEKIPNMVQRRGRAMWNGDVCVNFAAEFLAWLRQTINDDGVWRIRRQPKQPKIEVFRVEEAGHGEILTDDFINWRIKLAMRNTAPAAAS